MLMDDMGERLRDNRAIHVLHPVFEVKKEEE
jgi:hypothetical protein